jgi:outer membrane biosynthesis protein TonB
MPRDARFWRNVALITIAHLAVLLALARGSRDAAATNVQPVMWMNSEAIAEAKSLPTQTPVATPAEIEKQEEPAAAPLARSEIQLPSPTPTPTPTPRPTPKPSVTPTPVRKNSPTPSPKPIPKASPRKTVETKPTPKPSPKKEKADDEKKATPKEPIPGSNQSADKSSSPGRENGATQPSELAWYGTMLHDRFHKAWEQPKSIVATGAKMSTLVKIRIEKPSGNVVVDESVAAIAQRVTQVDPLPAGLGNGAYYEVKIDFELNAEK